MERLTKDDLKKVCYDPWEICGMDKHCTKGCHEEGGCTGGCHILKMHLKLAEYEDAEENGMLIHLPCRVGDRTYQVLRIYEAEKRGCTCCTTACGSNTDCEYFDKETDGCLNITGTNSFTIVSRGFKLEDYFDFGKTVFLAKEDAEQALAKIGE